MQPLDFLAAVLPSSGPYCVAEFTTPKKEHVFVDSLEEILNTADLFAVFGSEKKDAYFALASFKEKGKRTAENAKALKSLFIDIDIGEGKDYSNREEAIAAYEKFMEDTGLSDLGQPIVVSSGGAFTFTGALMKKYRSVNGNLLPRTLNACANRKALTLIGTARLMRLGYCVYRARLTIRRTKAVK